MDRASRAHAAGRRICEGRVPAPGQDARLAAASPHAMRVGGGKPQAFSKGGQGPRVDRLHILEESGIVAERAFRSTKRMHIVVISRSRCGCSEAMSKAAF